jgi:hypothetical protein
MSAAPPASGGDHLETQGYCLFGYRFAFRTDERDAARRMDKLYSPYRDESVTSGTVYELVRSSPDAAGWSIHLPDGNTKTASLLQDALYSAEAGICSEVIERVAGQHTIHGAVIYAPGGDLLISGVSGAGKTTLSLALASRGLRVGGDDAALLDPTTNLVEAIPRSFHVDDNSAALLQDEGLILPEEGWRYRFVTPADLGVVKPPPARIRFVFLLESKRGEHPHIEPQTQAEMTAALLMETGRGDFSDVEGVHALSSLVGQSDCYRVRSGPLGETADAIVRIVGRAA